MQIGQSRVRQLRSDAKAGAACCGVLSDGELTQIDPDAHDAGADV